MILHVPIVPKAQPRQRQRIVTKNGRSFAMNYTPANDPANVAKAAIKLELNRVMTGPPITGPVAVGVIAVFPRPASMFWKTKEMPRVRKPTKPDLDNIAKNVLDALNKLAFVDDALVARIECEKWIASGYEQPHLQITITELIDEKTESNNPRGN